MAPSGMEIMVKSLVKMLGIDPVILQGHVENIAKSLQTIASDAAIVRRQNSAIMAHLGIPDVVSEQQTLTQEHVNGTGTGSGHVTG